MKIAGYKKIQVKIIQYKYSAGTKEYAEISGDSQVAGAGDL